MYENIGKQWHLEANKRKKKLFLGDIEAILNECHEETNEGKTSTIVSLDLFKHGSMNDYKEELEKYALNLEDGSYLSPKPGKRITW